MYIREKHSAGAGGVSTCQRYGGEDRDSKCILHIYTGQCVSRRIDFADACQIQIDIQDLLANRLMRCDTRDGQLT